MYVCAPGYIKCGTIRVPCLYENKISSIGRSNVCCDNRYCSRKNLSVRYMKVSSMAMEKAEKEMGVKENLSSPYETAMEALSSLITRQSRRDHSTVIESYDKLERMSLYLKILGLDEKINGLKIIHVAGTKGKGSTCTFCEAILRNCGFRTGLFTSPHLIDVRERFRISGLDISEEKFLLYFWECWNSLKEKAVDGLPMPPLFQFLTLLAFKIFTSEQVDVAIVEVGLGGKRDSTNVIQEPVVCGITSLGMDHTETLGDTLGQIASHKAGIFKPRVPAFTASQFPEAMEVLQQRANELMVPLTMAAPLDPKKLEGATLSLSGDHQLINAGLAVSLCKSWLQRTGNWEKMLPNGNEEDTIPDAFRLGLSSAHISGRGQVVYDTISRPCISKNMKNSSGDLVFYLDGAHSPESMEACGRWFSAAVNSNNNLLSPSLLSSYIAETRERANRNGYVDSEEHLRNPKKESKQILLFNCMDVRDPQVLLPRLVKACASSGTGFSKALFVPCVSKYSKVISGASSIPSDILHRRDLAWQFRLQKIWERLMQGTETAYDQTDNLDGPRPVPPPDFLYGDARSAVIPSLPLTINWLRDSVRKNPSLKLEVLVTGSLHLVGDVLKLLRRR